MKTQNTFIALALLITAFTFGQNTFPTTGNVGIGTTTPGSKLEVLETTDSKPGGVVAPTKSVLKFTRNGTPNFSYPENAEFRIGHGGPNVYGSKLDLYINGGANTNTVPDQHVMTWNYDGNVGIGTKTPTNALTVQKVSGGIGFSGSDGTGGVRVNWTTGYGVALDSWDGSTPRWGITKFTANVPTVMIEGQYNTNNVIFNSGGSVGIGTITPTAKLDVNGSVVFNETASSYTNIRLGHDANDAIIADNLGNKAYGGGYWFRVHNESAGVGKYIDVMALSEAGNVGIGTTIPDEKLTVKGQIHALEVRIDKAGALVPDYVFANDYKLKTLSEVDSYIKANNHLPEIPSAKEIEKNGLILGEMNLSLLKKIEELTLYAIEQQKKLEAQNKDIEVLKAQNKQLESLSERLSRLEKK
jgi:Phage T4 tail fibre